MTSVTRCATLAGALLLLAACGGTTTTAGGGTAAPGAAGSGGTTITAADYSFSPATITVAPGAQVTLTFANMGTVTHNITQSDLQINQDATAGSSATINFTAPQSGTLSFHCQYHPTKMIGTIVVSSSAGAGAAPTSASSSSSGGGPGY